MALTQPHSPFRTHPQFTCPLFPRKKIYQGTAASVAVNHREVHLGEGNSLLDKLGRPLQNTRYSKRYGVCQKFGDRHTNLIRHSSGCNRMPPKAILPHPNELGGEPSATDLTMPSTCAVESSYQSEQSSQRRLLPGGIQDVGLMLDDLGGTTLARISLSTATAIRQEH